jgi:hypothetical protein
MLCESLTDSDIPHRTLLRQRIIQRWVNEHVEINERLSVCQFSYTLSELIYVSQCAIGNVSFTTNLWSNDNLRSFMALMAHWVSEDPVTKSLGLESALLAFHRVRECHTGESLARTILYLLDRSRITSKVCHGTLSYVVLTHAL